MTSYATNITPSAAPPRDRTGAVVALVVGGLAALVAFVLLAGAGTLLWASHYKTDDDGFYTSSTHTYSTPTRALTTENLDAATGVPGWLDASDHLGRVRIDPQGTGAFVGIAHTSDVNRYLDGVAHDEISDVDLDPFKIETARRAGEGRPAMPAAQTFWAATSTGGRTLDWKVRKGQWSVVTMNADGSPNVRVAGQGRRQGAADPHARLGPRDPGRAARRRRRRLRRDRRPRGLPLPPGGLRTTNGGATCVAPPRSSGRTYAPMWRGWIVRPA